MFLTLCALARDIGYKKPPQQIYFLPNPDPRHPLSRLTFDFAQDDKTLSHFVGFGKDSAPVGRGPPTGSREIPKEFRGWNQAVAGVFHSAYYPLRRLTPTILPEPRITA